MTPGKSIQCRRSHSIRKKHSRVSDMQDTRPEKVLIIESGEGVGGSAFSMYRIVKYLDKQKYAPHVFVYYQTQAFADIEKLGIPVTRLRLFRPFPEELPNNGSLFRSLRNYIGVYGNMLMEILYNGVKLARFIRKNQINIVHCNNGFFENIAAAFAARISGRPCVCHIRGTEPLMKIEEKLPGWINRFIVLNYEMLEVYSAAFGESKVRLVHNGVDLDNFANPEAGRIRSEFSIPEDAYAIGTFARLVEGKGIPEFLKAAAIVAQDRPNLVFLIAGGGSPADSGFVDQLHAMRDELGLSEQVIFAGWRDDVKDCMAAMDLVLQISTTFPEGMSLAPIEAMAMGKPVIVTDIAGYADIVDDGKTGYIVRAGDVAQLATLIATLADDNDLSRTLGENAYQRVLDMFESSIVARRVEEIYAQALSG